MSLFRFTCTLASKVVEMVDAIMKGGEIPINDTKTYDNGKCIVPSYLCEPVVVEKSNYTGIVISNCNVLVEMDSIIVGYIITLY